MQCHHVDVRCYAVVTVFIKQSLQSANQLSKVHIKLDRSVYKQGQRIKPEVEVTLETGKVTISSLKSCQLRCR